MSVLLNQEIYWTNWKVFMARITKRRAMVLFAHNHPGQRQVSPFTVYRYVVMMNRGEWNAEKHFCNDIEIYNKQIWNGQHRLLAFILSDLEEIWMPVSMQRKHVKTKLQTCQEKNLT